MTWNISAGWKLEGLRYVPPLGKLSHLQEGESQQRDFCEDQAELGREILGNSKVHISFFTHKWSDDSVFRNSTVVTNRVDNPAGNPDKPEGGGHFGIEESGSQEDDEEDWDSLQGVLVDSLVAVEDLLGVGIHGGVVNFVLLPSTANHDALQIFVTKLNIFI